VSWFKGLLLGRIPADHATFFIDAFISTDTVGFHDTMCAVMIPFLGFEG
jgi:hypothetical protein